jgi:ABC-2 type transport system ATP-binding protein
MSIINYSGVTKKYSSWPRANTVLALDDFSLQIEQGEVFGFLGPNGAGKSTALKILLNFVYPNAGTASLMGKNVSDNRSRGSIGYLPENPYFTIILQRKRSSGSAVPRGFIQTIFMTEQICCSTGWG